MKNRISIKQLEPAAYAAMIALENYCRSTPIKPLLKELVKIRASQINGCAYCVDMHTEDAISLGESPRRIFALTVWKESHLFTDAERAALQLTEEMTILSHGVSDVTYQDMINHFGGNGTAQLMMLIVVINAWNRIAVSTKLVYKL